MSSYVTRKTPGDTAWFTRDRFGMFIHFGLYAMPGLCEVDDLISNMLGTLVGVGLYKGYKRLAGCRVGGKQ